MASRRTFKFRLQALPLLVLIGQPGRAAVLRRTGLAEPNATLQSASSGLTGVERNDVDLQLQAFAQHEMRQFSQNGEDGVLNYTCTLVQCDQKTYVEFGAQDCTECNSRYLRANGWTGLVMDGGHENPDINLRKEYITPDNIVELLKKYSIKSDLDILSVDIDGIDFYVLREILCSGEFSPKIVMVEYNSHIPATAGAFVVPLKEPPIRFHEVYGNGMSVGAVQGLARKFGYELVYTMKVGVNAVLIRRDALPEGYVVPELALLDRPATYVGKGRDFWNGTNPWVKIEGADSELLTACRYKTQRNSTEPGAVSGPRTVP